jgi:hypothetical protein
MPKQVWSALLASRLVWLLVLLAAPPCPPHSGVPEGSLAWKTREDGSSWLYHPDRLLDAWIRHDAPRYLEIAASGYAWTDGTAPTKEGFFPGYPLLLGGVARVLRPLCAGGEGGALTAYALAGILLSQLAAVLAVILLFGLGRDLYGLQAATRAAVLLAVWPVSVALGAVLSDAVFLLASLLSARLALRGKPLLAGLAGGAAASIRVFGLAGLAIVLLVPRAARPARRLLGAAFVLLGFLGALVLFRIQSGDALVYFRVQRLFGHEDFPTLSGLPRLFVLEGYGADEAWRQALQVFTLALAVLLLAAGARDARRGDLPWALWLVAFAWILAPLLAGSVISLPRYALAAYPLLLVAARRLPGGVAGFGLAAAGVVGQGLLLWSLDGHRQILI